VTGASPGREPAAAYAVTFPRVVLSEWMKLRSLRSTRWSLFAAVVITIGFACLVGAIVAHRWTHMRPDEVNAKSALDAALFGVNLSQLAIGVLGVLSISSEYSTGMIRATMGAVPRRLPVLWAKVVVFGAVTFALMLPCVLISFFATQALLSDVPFMKVSLGDTNVLRTVVGGALFLTAIGIFALALGAITRNTAGGLATFVGIMFVIPPLMEILPASWRDPISEYLPTNAARDILELTNGPHSFGAWQGFGLFLVYTLGALGVAAALLARRDT